MERPRARPRNFFNTEKSDKDDERNQDDNVTPEKRPRRDRDRTRSATGARESTVENDSDLDTAELNRRIERLQRDLTRRDRELDDERLENEKVMDKIKKLERDKVELKREVEDFRLEAEEYKRTLDEYKAQMRSRGGSYSPGGSDSGHIYSDQNGNNSSGEHHHGSSKNYELIINQKNKEISQLIDDIEKLEQDKTNVQEKLTQLTDNLDDATKLIETMAQEHFNLKSKLETAEDQIRLLEEEKTVLQIKERDLMGFKERHEQYLDNLCKAVDIRVDIWKKMMLEKDEEISRLNSKIDTLMSRIPNMQLDSEQSTIRHLQSKLLEREDQISQLNDELSKATEEINSNIKLIEKLQTRLNATEDAEKTEKMVKSLRGKIKKLEEKLLTKEQQFKLVEREAEAESSEHASLLARIHVYESGEYGLAEAISEIKDLKNQIRIRDKQVESVTQEINILQMHVQDLEDENEMLRDKLGLDKNVDVNRETKRYLKNRKNEIIALRSKVNQLDDTIVQLKTMNYSLRKQLAQVELNEQQNPYTNGGLTLAERDRADGDSVASPRGTAVTNSTCNTGLAVNFKPEDWQQKYEIILEENTALRKGLHEILDAMHKLTDEGTSDVIIQSPVLEDLLREMSARGIINYPYPITSFHLKVCNLEGKCAQLREDLHRVRQEERDRRSELLDAKATILLYEEKLRQLELSPFHNIESTVREAISQEIQTGAQVTEAGSPVVDAGISEQEVAERITREKEKLTNLMEDLKLRIAELEESREIKGDDMHTSDIFEAESGELPLQMEQSSSNVAKRRRGKIIETQTDISFHNRVDAGVQAANMQMEAEKPVKDEVADNEAKEREALLAMVEKFKERIQVLENNLHAKDELIRGFKIIRPSHLEDADHSSTFSERQDALQDKRLRGKIIETQTDISFNNRVDAGVQAANVQMEAEKPVKDEVADEAREREALLAMVEKFKERIQVMENNLHAKDELIRGFKIIRPSHLEDADHSSTFSELQEALEVAREITDSLQERLKSKDESISQYRKLLAEVRKEMTNASERHVQEMRQMQLTIHQQQQAFTRMKSTLSQPVKDTMSIEGTIKDQLTRIHELEDEVSQLQHTLANVASQLTAARSDAHRWRCTAEMRLKEVEQAREHFSAETAEEVQNLRRKLKDTQVKLERAEDELNSNKTIQHRDSLSDLVSILRKELEEKDKQIGMYLKTLKSTTFNEKSHFENLLSSKEREIETFKEEIGRHQKSISSLQLRLSKTKAINYKAGITAELDELRNKNRDLQDEKIRLEKEIQEINSKRDEEEARKIKTSESIARWEESKRWKRSKEKLESRVKSLELENERLEKMVTTLKGSIHRLEKEKMMLESRLKSRHSLHHGSSQSKSSFDNISEGSAPSASYHHQNYIVAQGEIARLQMELQDTKEMMEKTEFEGREEIEKLKMEIRCLKERIVTQERQLTAYEIAQKGDPQVVLQIQKMAAQESEFQKEVIRLEEENLHLRLQIEQLQLETPRLRDRVQHLQKIVDVLKAEKPVSGQKHGPFKSSKPLGELERTITALKQVIEKLQAENKKLKIKSGSDLSSGTIPRANSERLRTSVSALMDEKRNLLDRVQSLESETEKYQRMYMEKCSVVDSYEGRLQDAEKRAKSTEMKLKVFLDERKATTQSVPPTTPSSNPNLGPNYDALTNKVKKLEVELLHKSQVLSTARQALKDAERMAHEWVDTSSTRASSSKSQGNVGML